MDFEFQNGTGPMDGRSPFAQISQNPQRFSPSINAAKKSMFEELIEMRGIQTDPRAIRKLQRFRLSHKIQNQPPAFSQ